MARYSNPTNLQNYCCTNAVCYAGHLSADAMVKSSTRLETSILHQNGYRDKITELISTLGQSRR